MSVLAAYARARAVREGRAQPIATVRHLHLSPRPMVFIPLRLAGEAAAPLGAMLGTDPAEPRLLVVPQPRDRDQRFAFVAELAAIMLPYIEGYARDVETVEAKTPYERSRDAPQLLVPNPRGIAFTRLLGRSCRFRRADGPYPVHPSVPVLGQWLTFLADRADFPGSSLLVAMTEALAAHWATGQSRVEDGNLAALVGWIAPPDGMTGPEAAAAAEDMVWSPPAGPDTAPEFDAEVLAPAIRTYEATGSAAAVRDAVHSQLEPTWQVMWRAVELLRGLPEARSVPARWERDRAEFTREAIRIAEGGLPRGRHDSAVGAAVRLSAMERAQQAFEAQRALDDPMVMVEHRLEGRAFAGEVVAVELDRKIVPPGRTRAVNRPLVTVATADPVRLAPGDVLVSPARPRQHCEVVEVRHGAVVLQVNDGMGRGARPAPGSVPEVGEAVCYADLAPGDGPAFPFPSREETPWTHGGPPAEYVPTDEDAMEDWS
ncbi:MAG: hypothetical protein DIU60_012040 [Actinomycetes bacterium]|jgi:hypothetical protein|nr:MAG: hypothetical protein DIU60_21275 [Actinomycetota bacterium]